MSSLQLSLWDHIPSNKWRNFESARKFVRNLGLSEMAEWDRYVTGQYRNLTPLPADIPYNPDVQYQNTGWEGWEDWLGIPITTTDTGILHISIWDVKEKPKWRTFVEAREVAREYEFEYKEEWDMLITGKFPDRQPLPADIPPNPDVIYRYTGWKGWLDWLVPKERRKEYTTYNKAREFVRCLRLKDISEWRNYILSDKGLHKLYNLAIPDKPDLEYRGKGWEDWNDWLGTEIKYKDYSTTRNFVKSLKLKNKTEWKDYCNNQLSGKKPKPEIVFTYPEIAYKNEGWNGWDHWLGIESHQSNSGDEGSGAEMVECRCMGKIRDCPECDGRGYVTI